MNGIKKDYLGKKDCKSTEKNIISQIRTIFIEMCYLDILKILSNNCTFS